ncbi:helix-hairpin-helix domain-containing protein [Streptococcus hongkongensis]|nr:competence protein [Streptococcus uberis]
MKEILTVIKQWYDCHYIIGRVIAVLLIIVLLCSFSYVFFNNSKADNERVKEPVTFSQVKEETGNSKEHVQEDVVSTDTKKEIMVDLKGAVKKEGVYKISSGSRVTDLIQMAGGLLPEADRQAINLAQRLTDASVVYVAKQGENKSVIPNPTHQSTQETGGSAKVNINSATSDQLTKIPGIGEKRAQEIIEARDKMGGFKSLDDLTKISGIGKKTIEKMKDDLSVD